MLLEKLLTDMTDEELKDHLSKLRRIHSSGASTRVRAQSTAKAPVKSINSAVRKLDPLKIIELAKLLAAQRGGQNA